MLSLRRTGIAITSLILLASLLGCGQTGPLRLPDPSPTPTPEAKTE